MGLVTASGDHVAVIRVFQGRRSSRRTVFAHCVCRGVPCHGGPARRGKEAAGALLCLRSWGCSAGKQVPSECGRFHCICIGTRRCSLLGHSLRSSPQENCEERTLLVRVFFPQLELASNQVGGGIYVRCSAGCGRHRLSW